MKKPEGFQALEVVRRADVAEMITAKATEARGRCPACRTACGPAERCKRLARRAQQRGARAEGFTFATRLTCLTRVLATGPAEAMRRAGELAPDWSGGTRIGAALREFLDVHGTRGMARSAVVVIISDGWETGDPAELGEQMARLSRLAYRVIWVNPRTASTRYQPLVGGMAAALPYCDRIVSAHRLDALGPLPDAIAGRGLPWT